MAVAPATIIDREATALARLHQRARASYDAAEDSPRRRSPSSILKSEDDILRPQKRRKLLGNARDLRRNFAVAAWAIRQHLNYVASFSFQARTGDDALDEAIEERIRTWSRPENCDLCARHGLHRLIRLAEGSRTIDGDVFALKLSSGRLQMIESDRVALPADLPHTIDPAEFPHGIRTSRGGRALEYVICKRAGLGALEFDKTVPARHVEPLAYFDRFDQVRGIAPMAPAINACRDLYEAIDYALAKAKISQFFGLVFKREAETALGDITATSDDTDGDGDEEDTRYEVDLGKGPVQLDLDPGDEAEFLESKTPSQEFQQFAQLSIQLALKGLDIPYSFFSEDFTNYSGARQAWIQYEKGAEERRRDLRHWLDRLTAWRLMLYIADGDLTLPAGWTLADVRWEWIATGVPWIDPLKEVKADIAALKAGLATRADILKRHGRDFYEVAAQLAREQKHLESLGLNPDPDPKTPAKQEA